MVRASIRDNSPLLIFSWCRWPRLSGQAPGCLRVGVAMPWQARHGPPVAPLTDGAARWRAGPAPWAPRPPGGRRPGPRAAPGRRRGCPWPPSARCCPAGRWRRSGRARSISARPGAPAPARRRPVGQGAGGRAGAGNAPAAGVPPPARAGPPAWPGADRAPRRRAAPGGAAPPPGAPCRRSLSAGGMAQAAAQAVQRVAQLAQGPAAHHPQLCDRQCSTLEHSRQLRQRRRQRRARAHRPGRAAGEWRPSRGRVAGSNSPPISARDAANEPRSTNRCTRAGWRCAYASAGTVPQEPASSDQRGRPRCRRSASRSATRRSSACPASTPRGREAPAPRWSGAKTR